MKHSDLLNKYDSLTKEMYDSGLSKERSEDLRDVENQILSSLELVELIKSKASKSHICDIAYPTSSSAPPHGYPELCNGCYFQSFLDEVKHAK